jgi:hypothetical protein
MVPGTGLALKRTITGAVIATAALIPTAVHTADTAWVIWRDGPATSGRGPGQHHYVLCVPADDRVNGPLREVRVAAADAYPVPNPVTGLHRYSEGQPCPDQPRNP